MATAADNGRTITLGVGGRLRVRLANTYWHFQPVANAAVLDESPPAVHVSRRPPKIPGLGQGVVSDTFTARQSGRTRVVATRTSCGEALRCTAGHGRFVVTVIVR